MFTIIFCNYYQLQISTFNGSLNFRYLNVRIAVNFPALKCTVCLMKTEWDRLPMKLSGRRQMLMRGAYKTAFCVFTTFDAAS
jgi:hypothetical protein